MMRPRDYRRGLDFTSREWAWLIFVDYVLALRSAPSWLIKWTQALVRRIVSPNPHMKVAVIGAGPAGLVCAHHLSKYPEYFQFQVFEQCKGIGGIWLYSPIAEDHVHSSAYKNLRTNIPKELMVFPDFPHPSHLPSYLTHQEVLKYLQDYVQHFSLSKFIKCGIRIEHIKPIFENDERTKCKGTTVLHTKTTLLPESDISFADWGRFSDRVKWKVTAVDVESGKKMCNEYDAVIVCTGCFSVPHTPTVPGLSTFPGNVIHSHVYREPEVYKDQAVLVIGSGSSGQDIAVDLSSHARQIYLCNRGSPLSSTLPSNTEELPGIAEVRSNRKMLFVNGQERLVDSIILATGYVYSYPFFTKDIGLRVIDGMRVTPLYKHTFNPIHPSMAIVGVNYGYNPFPYFDFQARWILSVWAGARTLPDKQSMIEEDESWFQMRLQQGLPRKKAAHYLGEDSWEMMNLIAELGGNKPQAPVMKMLFDEVEQARHERLLEYRARNYKILADDKWMAYT